MLSDEPDTQTNLVTQVLAAIPGEGRTAADLLPQVYEELRRLARFRMGAQPGETLQATALVHEAWMRLAGEETEVSWDSKAHFFGAAAMAMRNILVEQYRRRQSLKRGGGWVRIPEEELPELACQVPVEDMLALDEALTRLEAKDKLKADVVSLRFFAGLTMPEVAEVLGVSLTRVEREWRFTRSWLQRAVEQTRSA